ncbi:MAG: hypothetical protein WCG85_23935 [Polyangia bacterium]
MSTPEKLFEEWCQFTPKDADFDDVRRVAIDYLGTDNVRDGARGSHLLIIDGPLTRLACKVRDYGYDELAWIRETISIPTHGGKVKPVYVARLLKLIAFKLDTQKSNKP